MSMLLWLTDRVPGRLFTETVEAVDSRLATCKRSGMHVHQLSSHQHQWRLATIATYGKCLMQDHAGADCIANTQSNLLMEPARQVPQLWCACILQRFHAIMIQYQNQLQDKDM
jgi:hypothetical protein